jgi:branched-subunit amino acid ABC-type transport system permease component
MAISPDSARRIRRVAWVLGIVAGCLALVVELISYVTRGELRLELIAAGFTIIVVGLLMRPSSST